MPKRVLIVTTRGDLHADIVGQKIDAAGGRPFRLNFDEFPAGFDIDLKMTCGVLGGALVHAPTGDTLDVSEIGAVWIRKSAEFDFGEDLSPQEQAFASKEAEHVLLGLLYSLDGYWMSHPRAIRGALWKGEQLLRASRFGFQVPPSIVTNRRAAVEALQAATDGDIIFKTLSSPTLAAEEVEREMRVAGSLPTTRITELEEAALDAVTLLPCFFQPYVDKAYELRVTVIGDRVFAARIDSQMDPRTATDFRNFSAEIPYTAARLPPEVERRCRSFVHSYDLNYGAIDLIVTPNDEYVFLENNPGGQFLFVEELAPELDMTGALADCLVRALDARPA